MGDKIKLFNESDQEEQEDVEFRTNKSYAKHYDEFRKKEILGHLKNLQEEIGSSDSSDDDTTDDEIVDPEFDKEFFRTLAFLKRKDKDKYKEQQTFFQNVKPVEEVALIKRHHKEKPMTLKDYERKVMLEKGGVFEDEEDLGEPLARSGSPTMMEEEKKIKDEIKQALSKIGDDDSEEDEEEKGKVGGLLKERKKTAAETEKEQSDYIQWLADKKAKEPPSDEAKVLEPLKHFWNNEKLSKEDAFLKDYILNKRFVQSSGEVPTYDEIVATSEDEEELDKQEDYERQYNFRFEEPDADYIKQFPRTVEDSVRVERNKRKEQRQELKERKQKEKEQQRRELEELKAIKLKEIREKIQRLKEIAATEKLAMDVDDLESEFDPDEHDRRMKAMFDDEYYGVDEGDQKPEFPDLDQELGIENYDVERLKDDDEEGAEPHCEDDDFVMDCDYEEKVQNAKEAHQQELLESTKGRKKGRRQSKFREVLKAEKPLFDPEDEKTYGEYIDEYYKLDYEDMIGDIPCRFKYVETVPNDFGLSIEEILMANTSELNKWASVKKTVQLRPKNVELNEIQLYRKKAASEAAKRRVLPSLFKTEEEEEAEDEEIQQRKKQTLTPESKEKNDTKNNSDKGEKPKKKVKKQKMLEDESNTLTKEEKDTETNIEPQETSPAKKKKKKNKQGNKDESTQEEKTTITASSSKEVKAEGKPHKKPQSNGTVGEQKKQQNANNRQEKRKWKDVEESSNKPNGQWNNSKKPRFERKGPQNGFGHQSGGRGGGGGGGGGHKKNTFGSGHPKKEESAADQRLRAFGLNPTKFRNKKVYGKREHQNNNGAKSGFKQTSRNKK